MTKVFILKETVRPASLKGQCEIVAMSARKVARIIAKGLLDAEFSSKKGESHIYHLA